MRIRDRSQQVGALADRLGRVRERSFVGRDGERELLAAALAAEEEASAVLFFHGPGGIGKTALLRRLSLDAEVAGALPVVVDGRTISASPGDFTAAVAGHLGLPPGADPVAALQDGPRVVLLVDTFEKCAGLQGWLREEFLPRLPADALTVVAGRDPPEAAWRFDPAWQDVLRVIALRNLPPVDAGRLLTARGVPEAAHERLLASAGGHPLALCLVAEFFLRGGEQLVPPGQQVPGAPDVLRVLLERFVDEAPSARHRRALEVCAHARVTTESLLRAVLDDPAPGELFGWLRGRSFVEEGPEGVHPHDLARDVLDAELRWRDPDRYVDLHQRIREYLVTRLRAPDRDRTRSWRDMMFLHRRNPAFAPFLSWQMQDGVHEDRPRPGDRAVAHAMTTEAEGGESAAVLDHWLDRQPEGFRVFRRVGEPALVGFLLKLWLSGPEPADLAADPVVAAAWAHVRSSGTLRPGEHLYLLRTFVVPEAYHRPSPVMDLIQLLCAEDWTSPGGPAVSVLVLADPQFWAPQMAYIEHRPVSSVRLGRRTFTLFAHDWREVPAADWFRALAGRELAADPSLPTATVPPRRVVLSEPEFEAAVREALRGWRRTEDLARNPLCHSRLVADAAGDATRSQTLADLLVEATDSLAADPRDVKLHRAVATTYFHGVTTQEAAAERLGLPFSSYRRHLAAGIARVTSWLWDRELHGSGRPVGSG